MTTKKKNCSYLELDARTYVERTHIATARLRSNELLKIAQQLHACLHGESENLGPILAVEAYRAAEFVYFTVSAAVAARMARFEITKKSKVKKSKARKSKAKRPRRKSVDSKTTA